MAVFLHIYHQSQFTPKSVEKMRDFLTTEVQHVAQSSCGEHVAERGVCGPEAEPSLRVSLRSSSNSAAH